METPAPSLRLRGVERATVGGLWRAGLVCGTRSLLKVHWEVVVAPPLKRM